MLALSYPAKNPEVITKHGEGCKTIFSISKLKGKWHRVIPCTAKDIYAMMMLRHHEEKFAPAEGDGVIISDEAFKKLRAVKEVI
jgi:hypothetical protein